MISVAHNLQSSVFRAPTAREALSAARASLGDEAVVLSTRTVPNVLSGGGYVEVVARADHAAGLKSCSPKLVVHFPSTSHQTLRRAFYHR
jgi:flagellar biosynthesis GTPase FlhF